MGCGSSSQVIPANEGVANGTKVTNGINGVKTANGHKKDDDDDLPTVMLPESLSRPKPPIAFEIPLEEIDQGRKGVPLTPPPHLQRLLQPPQAEISLPDIEEKLAEAELRRQNILQQRAASAQKRSQKMMRAFNGMDKVDSDHENSMELNPEITKHPPTNAIPLPLGPEVGEGKKI